MGYSLSQGFSLPKIKPPTVGFPAVKQVGLLGANAVNSGNTTMNTGVQEIPGANVSASIPGLQQYLQPNLTLPSTPKSQAGFGGGTLTDANSSGQFGYAPVDPAVTDSDFFKRQLENDQQWQADLGELGAKQNYYQNSAAANAKALEIALGLPFDLKKASALGFNVGPMQGVNGEVTNNWLTDALASPEVVDEAGKNQFSTYAQIQQALNRANNAWDAQLAARGMGRSGEYADANGNYGYGQHHMDTEIQAEQARYAALQDMLGKLTGGVQTFQDQLFGLLGEKKSAEAENLKRQLALIQAGVLKAPSTNTPPSAAPNPLNNPDSNPFVGASLQNKGANAAGGIAAKIDNFLGGLFQNDDSPDSMDYTSVPYNQTGDALGDAQAAAAPYITPAVEKKYGLSSGIGNWRT